MDNLIPVRFPEEISLIGNTGYWMLDVKISHKDAKKAQKTQRIIHLCHPAGIFAVVGLDFVQIG